MELLKKLWLLSAALAAQAKRGLCLRLARSARLAWLDWYSQAWPGYAWHGSA